MPTYLVKIKETFKEFLKSYKCHFFFSFFLEENNIRKRGDVMKRLILFLGTGPANGVPVIGCGCDVCKKTKRLRPSILFRIGSRNFLIDASPDFRYQALKYNIGHIDGLMITHAHYDHIGGIDDLRPLSISNAIDTLLSKDSFEDIKRRLFYLFEKGGSFSVNLNFHMLKGDFGKTNFQGMDISYFSYFQQNTKVTGYRFYNIAYVIDIKKYSEDIFTYLKGLDLLILGGGREGDSIFHLNFEDAILFSKKVSAKKTVLTNLDHKIDYEELSKKLPSNITLAYDGMECSL